MTHQKIRSQPLTIITITCRLRPLRVLAESRAVKGNTQGMVKSFVFFSAGLFNSCITRLASVGILGKEREPGVGKLGWHKNFYIRTLI